jgi:DNA-binding transcriptional regulator YiaG
MEHNGLAKKVCPTCWNAQRIRELREFLDMTQRQMAQELQVRQQTISEWETGIHTPHRSTQKLLTMLAERAGFANAEPLNANGSDDYVAAGGGIEMHRRLG